MSPSPDIKPLIANQTKAFMFFFSFLWFCFFPSPCTAGDDNTGYTDCAPRSCNGIHIDYPFSLSSTQDTSCGYSGLYLTCRGDGDSALPFLITPTGVQFIVKGINYTTQTIKLAIEPSLMVKEGRGCRLPYANITLSNITNDGLLPLRFSTNYRSVTLLYGCSAEPSAVPRYDSNTKTYVRKYDYSPNLVSGCSVPESNFSTYAFYNEEEVPHASQWLSPCSKTLRFPILSSSFSSGAGYMASYLSNEFDLVWAVDSMGICEDCTTSGGRCGYNTTNGYFLCFCKQKSRYGNCNGHDSRQWWQTIVGGLAIAVGGFLLACLLFLTRSLWVASSRTAAENGCFQLHTPAKLEKILLEYKTLTATRYTYNDITKMTKKFKYKLGKGGYGSVFQGWLSNGTPVAVKLIEKSYNDGEEFCNEVATTGTIHHVNVVRLLGFCIEGSQRVLVYEFMPNGSLEKITNSIIVGRCMFRPERLYDIGLGIAKGIEYLHQGCHRRIIHFDIKPHNILLDHDYTPKISDFGLARSYCKERSTVTITEGKGTIGYIAPEVFYGNSRHVSHKSDVYSFGMLLVAMLGMKEKIGPTGGSSSEAYFPQWIYDTLSLNQEFEGTREGQEETIRKLTTIALWCIQWNPVDRPSMKEVVRMFESSTSNLSVPPNHFYPATEPEYMIRGFESSSLSE